MLSTQITTMSSLSHVEAMLTHTRKECVAMLRRRAAVSAMASAAPVPGIDIATDVSLMLDIFPRISERFGLHHDQVRVLEPRAQAILLKSYRTLGPTLVGRVITPILIVKLITATGARLTAKQAARYIPVLGSLSAAAIGYHAFMHVGKRHIHDCMIASRALLIRDAVPHPPSVLDGEYQLVLQASTNLEASSAGKLLRASRQ